MLILNYEAWKHTAPAPCLTALGVLSQPSSPAEINEILISAGQSETHDYYQ